MKNGFEPRVYVTKGVSIGHFAAKCGFPFQDKEEDYGTIEKPKEGKVNQFMNFTYPTDGAVWERNAEGDWGLFTHIVIPDTSKESEVPLTPAPSKTIEEVQATDQSQQPGSPSEPATEEETEQTTIPIV